MLNRIRSQRSACTHEDVERTPGTGVYGIDRAICIACGRIFVSHIDKADTGALFKSREEGALAMGNEAHETQRMEHV